VEEDKISLSKGAEILRISIDEMNDLLNSWEVVL
jgi:predicted HTH domain antitoxin